MASGYFPLDESQESGKKLLEAVRLIEEVIENFYDNIYSGADGQFDNAASDGGSLALLSLAIGIIKREVNVSKVNRRID